MSEPWAAVAGADGYLVRRDGTVLTPRGKIASVSASGSGYLVVNVNRKITLLHRIIAKAFVPNPLGLPCVNHIDGDKKNNAVGNLEWCTYLHNTRHAIRTGLIRSKAGEGNPFAKLRASDVLEIRAMLDSGVGRKEIADRYGMCSKSIYNIGERRTWSHIPVVEVMK